MGKLPEGYVTVKARVAKFLAQHGQQGAITTEVTVYLEKESALTKATIAVEGKVIATGHSMCDLGEDKGLEKGETVAIGRALEFAGFESVDSDEDTETSSAPTERRSRFSRSSNSAPEKQEDDSEKAETSAPKSGGSRFPRSTAQKEQPAEETSTDDTDDSQTEESSPAQEKQTPPAAKTGGSKISELSARYGVKSNAGAAQVRR